MHIIAPIYIMIKKRRTDTSHEFVRHDDFAYASASWPGLWCGVGEEKNDHLLL